MPSFVVNAATFAIAAVLIWRIRAPLNRGTVTAGATVLAHLGEVPKNLGKELKTAPLTAAFGMFVIFTYAIAGIFAPLIAPYGFDQVESGGTRFAKQAAPTVREQAQRQPGD